MTRHGVPGHRPCGRGKLDRHHQNAVPIKDVYLYPLHRHYQRILTTPADQI
jgi:hypothetical protein